MKFEYGDIPAHLVDTANNWREKMVEAAAEASEDLMNEYLENGDLSEDQINAGLRTRTIACEIQPMLCGSAFKNKGVQAMLDAVIRYLPAPGDVEAIKGILDDKDESVGERVASDDEPFARLPSKSCRESSSVH